MISWLESIIQLLMFEFSKIHLRVLPDFVVFYSKQPIV